MSTTGSPRCWKPNDNALVESKIGSDVRKHFGDAHIPARYADVVNAFCINELTPCLNYHRPSWFPGTVRDDNGRQRQRYPYQNPMCDSSGLT